MTRGGPRPGSGRPRGAFTGRTVRAVNVTIPPDLLEEIADAADPGESRSAFVCAAVRGEIQQRARLVELSAGEPEPALELLARLLAIAAALGVEPGAVLDGIPAREA